MSISNAKGLSLFFAAALLLLAPFGAKELQAQNANAAKCAPTEGDALGPFYISGTPVLKDLGRFEKSGAPMRINGEIRDAKNPHTPIAGAKVEIWHTDDKGDYSPENNGDYSNYDDRDIDLRGTVLSDDDGRFSVLSVIPGEYAPRPNHIHYVIRAEGFKTLVTQHYLDIDYVSCRSAPIDRTQSPAVFSAPTVYLLSSD